MLKPEFTGQFKRDYKLAIKRGCNPKKLEEVVTMLCNERPLPESYRNHALTNSRNYKDMRECHIEPDWLLVYKVYRETLILKLIRTGSHRKCRRNHGSKGSIVINESQNAIYQHYLGVGGDLQNLRDGVGLRVTEGFNYF